MKITYIFFFVFILHGGKFVNARKGEEHITRKGHGEPLGSHRPSDGEIDILVKFPTPKEFWDKYMSIGKPCLFKGAANQYPAIKKWTDDYLIEKYGKLQVKLEHKYEKGKTPIGTKGVGRDTIEAFLNTYLEEPKYIVSQLPDPMSEEIYVLPFLTCGSFKERLLEANLWLSSGGTRSLLHKDADNAINCVLNGTKEWILIHPKYTKYIPVAEGDKGYGGFATLKVEKVNLKKYPKFQHVRYNHVTMKPGDCLFLPKSYWHQVKSFGDKNLAVSVLFSRLEEFHNTGCENPEKLKYIKLSESGMVWTYPGHGPQTLGNMDPFELRENLLGLFDGLGKSKLTAKDFEHMFPGEDEDDDGIKTNFEKEKEKLGQSLLNIFRASNQSKFVVEDDIETASMHQLKEAATAIDPDPANTDEYEHFLFTPDTVAKVVKQSINNNGRLVKKSLLENYKKIGGSESMAERIYTLLSSGSHTDEVGVEIVRENTKELFEQFSKRRPADKSGEYYQRNLDDDLNIMNQKITEKQQQSAYDESDIINDSDFLDLNEDGYPDHEPIYQPEDPDHGDDYITQSSETEFTKENKDDDTSNSPPSHYLDEIDDDNDDYYPDHDPVYQPENPRDEEEDESNFVFNRDEL